MTTALQGDFFGGGALAVAPRRVYAPGEEPNPKNPGGVSDNELRRRNRAVQTKKLERQRADALAATKKKIAKDIQRKQKEASKAAKKRSGGVLGDLKRLASPAIAVVDTGAKIAKAAVKTTAKGIRTAGKELAKVPVVGAGLKGALDLTIGAPFQVADDIVRGHRLDTVAIDALKAHVASVREVAPYAQTVISVVPAVGPGLSAGIGAGLALASGQSLTDSLVAGVKSALPGGALAQSAFALGKAAVEGAPLDAALVDALPIGPKEKTALRAGLDAAKRVARGERVDRALLAQADKALGLLPKDARAALQTGVAIAQGRSLQNVAGEAAKAGITAAGLKVPTTLDTAAKVAGAAKRGDAGALASAAASSLNIKPSNVAGKIAAAIDVGTLASSASRAYGVATQIGGAVKIKLPKVDPKNAKSVGAKAVAQALPKVSVVKPPKAAAPKLPTISSAVKATAGAKTVAALAKTPSVKTSVAAALRRPATSAAKAAGGGLRAAVAAKQAATLPFKAPTGSKALGAALAGVKSAAKQVTITPKSIASAAAKFPAAAQTVAKNAAARTVKQLAVPKGPKAAVVGAKAPVGPKAAVLQIKTTPKGKGATAAAPPKTATAAVGAKGASPLAVGETGYFIPTSGPNRNRVRIITA